MGFSEKQVLALQRKLNDGYVRTRELQSRTLSYIEGWHAIAEANRIFGFEGWDRETVETKCVLARENDGGFQAVYIAKVRITVRAAGDAVLREGYGIGEAQGHSAGSTHEKALKTAETDATKRALATFGKPFGLALYVSPMKDRNGSGALPGPPALAEHDRRRTRQRVGRDGRYFVPARAKVILDATLPIASPPDAVAIQAEAASQPKGAASSEATPAVMDGAAPTPNKIASPPSQPVPEAPSEQSPEPRLLIDWPSATAIPSISNMCGRNPA